MPEKSSDERRKKQSGPPLLEWASGAVGALLAIGILVFIAIEALDSSAGRPPLLEVRTTGVFESSGLYVVEVTVANRTGQTAAAVEIQGELMEGERAVETSNATVSYVPGHSERNAGLIFSRDPRAHQLQVRATGYEQP